MDTKFSFPKLNNDNYFNWKYRMQLLLRKEICWKAIGDPKPPANETSKLESWLAADEKARCLIGLSVSDNQLSHVRDKTTALDSWNALKNFHEKSTLVNKITLMRSLWDLKLNDSKDPNTHIEIMTSLFQKLVDLGEQNLTESWKVSILLSSLPSSYNTLVTALEA